MATAQNRNPSITSPATLEEILSTWASYLNFDPMSKIVVQPNDYAYLWNSGAAISGHPWSAPSARRWAAANDLYFTEAEGSLVITGDW